MVFDFLKKDKKDAPPDVGQEEVYEAEKGGKGGEVEGGKDSLGKAEEGKPLEELKAKASESIGSKGVGSENLGAVSGLGRIEFEKINARIESVVAWINQFYERFSYVSESIGEIRTMNLANEKKISTSMAEAEKAIDIVKEVKPEQLRMDYQRFDMRLKKFEEMLAGNKEFMNEVMKEVSELRRKSEVFIGIEGLIKLNEDTKKDLIEIQKLGSRVRLHADKSEQFFMELRKNFADSQKIASVVDNLDASYSGLKEELERMRLDYGTVIKRKDYEDFRKTYGNKLAVYDNTLSDVENLKKQIGDANHLIETVVSISKRNEEDIGNMALKVGDDSVKRVSDYENQMAELLKIVEILAGQVADMRKKLGIKSKKILLKKSVEKNLAKLQKSVKEEKENIVKEQVKKKEKLKKENKSLEEPEEKINESLESGKDNQRVQEEIENEIPEEKNSAEIPEEKNSAEISEEEMPLVPEPPDFSEDEKSEEPEEKLDEKFEESVSRIKKDLSEKVKRKIKKSAKKKNKVKTGKLKKLKKKVKKKGKKTKKKTLVGKKKKDDGKNKKHKFLLNKIKEVKEDIKDEQEGQEKLENGKKEKSEDEEERLKKRLKELEEELNVLGSAVSPHK